MQLQQSLRAWNTPEFETVFKREISQLGIGQLPLQQGLSVSNFVTEDPVTVMIHHVIELESVIRVQAGILYQGMIAGCSCADDPTPDNSNNEYCVVQFDINKATAETAIILVPE